MNIFKTTKFSRIPQTLKNIDDFNMLEISDNLFRSVFHSLINNIRL